MERQQIISGYERMRKDIAKYKDQYLEQLYIYIKTYFKQPKELWSWEVFSSGLEELIYQSLAKTYSITIDAAEDLYNIQFKETIDAETLERLTYSGDGKSLSERLKSHYDEAITRDNIIEYFYNRVVLIMDTETLYSSNHVIHGKLKRRATHAEVINDSDDFCFDHEMCEYWVGKGKMPIDELEELPPYHPDCECEVIYYFDENKE